MSKYGKNREFEDQDYWSKLSPEEKKFLSKFNREYYHGDSFTQSPEKNVHTTVEQKRDCYNRRKRQERDLYSSGKKSFLEDLPMKLKKKIF